MKNEIEQILNNSGTNVQGMSLEQVRVRHRARLILVTEKGTKEFTVTASLINFMKGLNKSIWFGSTDKRGKKMGMILIWE